MAPFFRPYLLVLLLLIFTGRSGIQAQKRVRDSLEFILSKANNDTVLCETLHMLTGEIPFSEEPVHTLRLVELCEKRINLLDKSDTIANFYKAYLGSAYNDLALREELKGNISRSLEYHHKSMKLKEETNNAQGITNTLGGIGLLYYKMGDIPRSLEYFDKGLRINERMKDTPSVALSLSNIAMVYRNQEDYQKALEYMQKCLKLSQASGNKKQMAAYFHNMGALYSSLNDTTHAIEFYKKAIAIREMVDDKRGVASSLTMLAHVYIKAGRLKEAEQLLHRSSDLHKNLTDKQARAYLYQTFGQLYIDSKKYDKAIEFGKKTLEIGKENNYPNIIGNAAMILKTAYKRTGDYARALEFSELYTATKDSISSEANKKAAITSQLKYEFGKKAVADSVEHAKETELKNAELYKQKAEIRAKRNQQYVLYGGLSIVLIFSGFIFNRYKVTSKQKSIIELQKEEVEIQKQIADEKQKEILDSIYYARRIQMALLPGEQYILKLLKKLKKPEA